MQYPLTIGEYLKLLSPTESKVYLWILEQGVGPYPQTFKINAADISKACDLSIPTVSKAVQGMVEKGVLYFIDRPYRTAPGNYAIPHSNTVLEKPIILKTPEQIASSLGMKETRPQPKNSAILDLIYSNALELLAPEHLPRARAIYGAVLDQVKLRDYVTDYIWKRREQKMSEEDAVDFLSRVLNNEPVSSVAKDYIKKIPIDKVEYKSER